uniref:Fe2OG dioxygenase domain-containing protein n=1 Tax=Phaeomonas parva TaxID=124430 RepID=A0A6U4DUF5_9STRA|mmetsp:Transcript_1821/g.5287  ORF Transcript_1821/g.5287 Transcript_1821/m.5287 type:complete len:460 (+) Transcript_1821:109-1488(+)
MASMRRRAAAAAAAAATVAMLLLAAGPVGIEAKSKPKNSNVMTVWNEAGVPINAYWLNPDNGKLVKQVDKAIRPGLKYGINTYKTHTFVFTQVKQGRPEPKKVDSSMPRHSHTGEPENVYISMGEDGLLKAEMKTPRQLKIEEAEKAFDECGAVRNSTGVSAEQRLLDFEACAKEKYISKVATLVDRMELDKQIFDSTTSMFRNYTCADPDMELTDRTDRQIWVDPEGHRVDVGVLFNSSHATIRYNKDFLTEGECAAIKRIATPKLHRATTADSDGGDKVSFTRRADQASIDYYPKAKPGSDRDIVNGVIDRLYSYVNYFTDYDLDLPGQEGITAIRYNVSDEYHPHCDGACDGSMHKDTGRVATMVMYCDMPPADGGGGTTFSRAGVFTKGVPQSSVFFSYMGQDGRMDDGLTEHSGCPIFEGSKFIATMWFRKGVSKDRKWFQSDPLGYPKAAYKQ